MNLDKHKEQVEYEGQELKVKQDTEELLTVCIEMISLWKTLLKRVKSTKCNNIEELYLIYKQFFTEDTSVETIRKFLELDCKVFEDIGSTSYER